MTEGPGADSASLKTLMTKIDQFSDQHKYESQRKLIEEALPQAKANRDFVSYIHLLFITANSCNSTLTPIPQRDASVELITLLESMDAARRIQPDLSEETFEELKHWYSSCAYDNLAVATANIEGFNSEGMYEAVTEGIEKCRQTGKTQCITCFREYSVLVSMAADDLELAAKQAHQLALRGKDAAQHDRRAVAWKDLGRIQILAGDLEASLQSFDSALAVAKEYHDPDDIEFAVHRYFDLVYSLLGRPEQYKEFCETHPSPKLTEPEECRIAEQLQDHVLAVKACINTEFDRAIELRKKWIQRSNETQNLANWFDFQVMLISTLKLKDPNCDVSQLMTETRSKAKEKRDWITLKRLACIEHPEFTLNPLGTIAPFLTGPYAAKDQNSESNEQALNKEAPGKDGGSETGVDEREKNSITPMMILFQETTERLQKEEDQAGIVTELADELKGVIPNTLENAMDASFYLRMLAWAFQLGVEVKSLWRSAKMVSKLFPKDPSVSGLLADLADAYRILENEAERPSVEDVDNLYQAALGLDISHVQTYFNAGAFYKSIGRVSEAERCFARACRLDRSWAPAALALAEIYLNSDRPTDAVDVLDLAVRHGCTDPNVVWQAGLGAFRLEMWIRSISYFQLFRQIVENQPFTQYYTALALCHLEKYQEAVKAIEIEVKINPGIGFAAHSIKCLSYAHLGQVEDAQAEIDICLKFPFSSVQGLNKSGMSKAAERIRQATIILNDQERGDKIVERAFQAGIVSHEFFAEQRALNKTREEVDLCLYEVSLNQKISEAWKDDINCPPWEANWQSYRVNWLVLAPTKEQAEAMAMAYQKTCATDEAECLGTERVDDKVLRGQEWGVVDHSPRDPKINA